LAHRAQVRVSLLGIASCRFSNTEERGVPPFLRCSNGSFSVQRYNSSNEFFLFFFYINLHTAFKILAQFFSILINTKPFEF
jgi:hypothetical protein